MTDPRDSNNATWCQKWLDRSEQPMASVPLQPPAKFNFSNPDEWPKWRRRFEQFRIASGMAGESEERQISTLLYCLGEEAEDVLTSTNISEADRGRYAQVLGKMDEFFKVRKNVIFERARSQTHPCLLYTSPSPRDS